MTEPISRFSKKTASLVSCGSSYENLPCYEGTFFLEYPYEAAVSGYPADVHVPIPARRALWKILLLPDRGTLKSGNTCGMISEIRFDSTRDVFRAFPQLRKHGSTYRAIDRIAPPDIYRAAAARLLPFHPQQHASGPLCV